MTWKGNTGFSSFNLSRSVMIFHKKRLKKFWDYQSWNNCLRTLSSNTLEISTKHWGWCEFIEKTTPKKLKVYPEINLGRSQAKEENLIIGGLRNTITGAWTILSYLKWFTNSTCSAKRCQLTTTSSTIRLHVSSKCTVIYYSKVLMVKFPVTYCSHHNFHRNNSLSINRTLLILKLCQDQLRSLVRSPLSLWFILLIQLSLRRVSKLCSQATRRVKI